MRRLLVEMTHASYRFDISQNFKRTCISPLQISKKFGKNLKIAKQFWRGATDLKWGISVKTKMRNIKVSLRRSGGYRIRTCETAVNRHGLANRRLKPLGQPTLNLEEI